jgi:hypothetical protein
VVKAVQAPQLGVQEVPEEKRVVREVWEVWVVRAVQAHQLGAQEVPEEKRVVREVWAVREVRAGQPLQPWWVPMMMSMTMSQWTVSSR